jgi:hypothetical protein
MLKGFENQGCKGCLNKWGRVIPMLEAIYMWLGSTETLRQKKKKQISDNCT